MLRSAISRVCLLGWLVFALCVAPSTRAGDLEDFFTVNENDGSFGGRLYAGRVAGVRNGDDITFLQLSGQGRSLTYFGKEQNGDFDDFVNANADTIIAILFPSDLEGAAQGVPGAAARALEAFDRLVDIGTPPAGRRRAGDGADLVARNNTSALFEYERYHVDGLNGNGFKLTPGYDGRVGLFEVGFAMPLRFNDLEDAKDTKAYTVGLDLHAKYHWYLLSEWKLIPMIGAGSNLFCIDADGVPGAGYVRYGGYVGVATTWRPRASPFVIGGGLLYSVSDVAVPDGLIPDDLEALTDGITSRPADQQITVGAKAAYEVAEKLYASVGGRHLETVGSSSIEDGKRGLSQVSAAFGYFPTEYVGLELGYKYLFGASDLSSHAGYLQGVLYF